MFLPTIRRLMAPGTPKQRLARALRLWFTTCYWCGTAVRWSRTHRSFDADWNPVAVCGRCPREERPK